MGLSDRKSGSRIQNRWMVLGSGGLRNGLELSPCHFWLACDMEVLLDIFLAA